MKAFNNNQEIKDQLLVQLKGHYAADEIVKGHYWENGTGCGIGCAIHSNSHKDYSEAFGIPLQLAYLQDRIFENLPNNLAKEWPIQFTEACPVGVDLSPVWKRFMIWLLTDPVYGVLQYAKDKKIVQDVADAYEADIIKPLSIEVWQNLKDAAVYAAYAAAADASSAASSAAADAYAAAYASAYAAADDAYAAYAGAADAAATDAGAISKISWDMEASKKLIELLKQAQ